MLAERLDAVIGVDTHKHTHTAAAVASTGTVLDHLTVATGPKGYRQVLAFGRRHGAAKGDKIQQEEETDESEEVIQWQ